MTVKRSGAPTFEQGDHRVCVRFRLNCEPDAGWISLFKRHATSVALHGAKVTFGRRDLAVEVPGRGDFSEIVTALDCVIECANLLAASTPRRVAAPAPRTLVGAARPLAEPPRRWPVRRPGA